MNNINSIVYFTFEFQEDLKKISEALNLKVTHSKIVFKTKDVSSIC